jgi:hypothetical protein
MAFAHLQDTDNVVLSPWHIDDEPTETIAAYGR